MTAVMLLFSSIPCYPSSLACLHARSMPHAPFTFLVDFALTHTLIFFFLHACHVVLLEACYSTFSLLTCLFGFCFFIFDFSQV